MSTAHIALLLSTMSQAASSNRSEPSQAQRAEICVTSPPPWSPGSRIRLTWIGSFSRRGSSAFPRGTSSASRHKWMGDSLVVDVSLSESVGPGAQAIRLLLACGTNTDLALRMWQVRR
jgi:hypothetical protein